MLPCPTPTGCAQLHDGAPILHDANFKHGGERPIDDNGLILSYISTANSNQYVARECVPWGSHVTMHVLNQNP